MSAGGGPTCSGGVPDDVLFSPGGVEEGVWGCEWRVLEGGDFVGEKVDGPSCSRPDSWPSGGGTAVEGVPASEGLRFGSSSETERVMVGEVATLRKVMSG